MVENGKYKEKIISTTKNTKKKKKKKKQIPSKNKTK
jgi:hypothetical protein